MESNIELFEKFHKDELSELEKRKFINRLEIDRAFREDFELYNKIEMVLNDKDLINLYNSLNLKNKKVKLYSKHLAWAAGFLILISITIYYFKPSNDIPEALLDTYYYASVSKDNNNSQKDIENAIIEFNSKNYNSAIIEFESILKKNSQLNHVEFLLAMSYLNSGNYLKSIALLETISENKESYFWQDAQWYLAVAYYKSGRRNKAEKKFEEISKSNNAFKSKSLLMLKQLNNE